MILKITSTQDLQSYIKSRGFDKPDECFTTFLSEDISAACEFWQSKVDGDFPKDEIDFFWRGIMVVITCTKDLPEDQSDFKELLTMLQVFCIPKIHGLISKVAERVAQCNSNDVVLLTCNALVTFAELSSELHANAGPLQFLVTVWKALSRVVLEHSTLLQQEASFIVQRMLQHLEKMICEGLDQMHSCFQQTKSGMQWGVSCKLTIFFLGRLLGLYSRFLSTFTPQKAQESLDFLCMYRVFVDPHLLQSLSKNSPEFVKLNLPQKTEEAFEKLLGLMFKNNKTWLENIMAILLQKNSKLEIESLEDKKDVVLYGKFLFLNHCLNSHELDSQGLSIENLKRCLGRLLDTICGLYPLAVCGKHRGSVGAFLVHKVAQSIALLVTRIAKEDFAAAQMLLFRLTLHPHPLIQELWSWVWCECMRYMSADVQLFFLELLFKLAINDLQDSDQSVFADILLALLINTPQNFQTLMIGFMESKLKDLPSAFGAKDPVLNVFYRVLGNIYPGDMKDIPTRERLSHLQKAFGQVLGSCKFTDHSLDSLKISKMIVAILQAKESKKGLGEDLLRQGIQKKAMQLRNNNQQGSSDEYQREICEVLSLLCSLKTPVFDIQTLEALLHLCCIVLSETMCKDRRGMVEVLVLQSNANLSQGMTCQLFSQRAIQQRYCTICLDLIQSTSWASAIQAILYCTIFAVQHKNKDILEQIVSSKQLESNAFMLVLQRKYDNLCQGKGCFERGALMRTREENSHLSSVSQETKSLLELEAAGFEITVPGSSSRAQQKCKFVSESTNNCMKCDVSRKQNVAVLNFPMEEHGQNCYFLVLPIKNTNDKMKSNQCIPIPDIEFFKQKIKSCQQNNLVDVSNARVSLLTSKESGNGNTREVSISCTQTPQSP